MKKIILLLTICTLISSCGLFKRTEKKVDKSEQVGKSEQLTKTDKSTSEKSSEQSSTKAKEQSTERDTRDLDNSTSIEADEIFVDNNGNISAKGNAKVKSNTKDKGVNEKASNKEVESGNSKHAIIDTKEQKEDRTKQENKEKHSDTQTVSEPSGKGIVFGAIGVLIVVFGLLWYFGVKRKS